MPYSCKDSEHIDEVAHAELHLRQLENSLVGIVCRRNCNKITHENRFEARCATRRQLEQMKSTACYLKKRLDI
jgi:hypothetical protein